jgi:hypothetical protein
MSHTPTIARPDHAPDDDLTTGLPPGRALVTAAAAGVIGGLTLVRDLALHGSSPIDRSHLVVATVMALCLLGTWGQLWAWAGSVSSSVKRHDKADRRTAVPIDAARRHRTQTRCGPRVANPAAAACSRPAPCS